MNRPAKVPDQSGRARRERKQMGVFLSVVLSTLGCAAVGGPQAFGARVPASAIASGLHAAARDYKIVFMPGTVDDPFFVTMDNGMMAEAKKLGVSVNWQGPPLYEPSLQIPILESVLAEHPDFVLISPTDDKALIAPMEQLKAAGIPVMTLDSDVLNKSVRLGNITSDDMLGGEDASAILAKALGSHGEVAMFSMTRPALSQRTSARRGSLQGIRKFARDRVPGTWHNNDDPTAAAAQATGLLSRYPKLDGIFASDDDQGAGAAIAVKSAGRNVKIVAFDAEPEQVTDLKRGLLCPR